MAMCKTDRNAITAYVNKHYDVGDGCWLKKKPVNKRPRIFLDGKGQLLVNVLYEMKYGTKPPILRQCPKSIMCVNPDHSIPATTNRRYLRHTDECGGYDWALVEIVTQAGTINVLPPDATICDCDRARIVLEAPNISTAAQWLNVSGVNVQRLADLGKTLWPTLTQS